MSSYKLVILVYSKHMCVFPYLISHLKTCFYFVGRSFFGFFFPFDATASRIWNIKCGEGLCKILNALWENWKVLFDKVSYARVGEKKKKKRFAVICESCQS